MPRLDGTSVLRTTERAARRARELGQRPARPQWRSGGRPLGTGCGAFTVGERRSFHVWRQSDQFEQVFGRRAVRRAPRRPSSWTRTPPQEASRSADLEAFADRFDDVIHPEVTSHFGSESDLDQNQRVTILFTPVVNALTPRGSSGLHRRLLLRQRSPAQQRGEQPRARSSTRWCPIRRASTPIRETRPTFSTSCPAVLHTSFSTWCSSTSASYVWTPARRLCGSPRRSLRWPRSWWRGTVRRARRRSASAEIFRAGARARAATVPDRHLAGSA